MKKLAIAIALVLLVGAFAMAADVVITGSATTTAGYNLDTKAYGLKSDVSSDVSITVGEADGTKQGDGAWYGVIELTGASISWFSGAVDGAYRLSVNDVEYYDAADDAWYPLDSTAATTDYMLPFMVTAPDVMAKITNGNLYVMLQSEASFAADYVAGIEDDAQEYAASTVSGSLTFGGMFGPASVALELGTAGDYEGAAQDGVELGFTLGLDVAPLTVDAAFAGGFGYAAAQDMAFAVQVGADVAPLAVTGAFDYNMPAVGSSTMEVGANVSADLAPLSVGLDVYYGTDASDTADDVDTALSVGYATDAMTVDVAFEMDDVMTALAWAGTLDLTYAVNSGVALAAGMGYDSASVMSAYANVALTEIIDNVTFTLGWENGDDLTKVGADGVDELGQVIFSTEIAYY